MRKKQTTTKKGDVAGKESLSVVLSFRNEEEVIPELISRLDKVLCTEDIDYELIFVNDDSTDGSLEILRDYAERTSRVKVVNMARRFGQSECVLAGMKYATGDAVLYIDTDLQDPPEIIPELLNKWRAGADVVYTVRTKRQGEHPFKMWLTRQAYRAINAFSEVDLPVESGDFRLIDRKIRDLLLKFPETDAYIRGLVRWVGYRQEPVYYERAPRTSGECHFPLFTSAGPAKTFFAGLTSFTSAPVYFIFATGAIASVLSALGLLLIGIIALFSAVSKTVALVFFLIFLWGTGLFALGFVGIYVARTYKDVRQRPRFIVRDTIGFTD